MILISHRGNTDGKSPDKENLPSQIELCLSLGYDVEIDVRYVEGSLFLGHDGPEHPISKSWLESMRDRAWIHCKNIEAMEFFRGSSFNWFWHDRDAYTLTSRGHIWAYPGAAISEGCIAVLPESWAVGQELRCLGVCSDFISRYKI